MKRGHLEKMRAPIAALLFCAIAAALALAALPQLHDRLHGTGAKHECAVTLISAGSIEHSVCEPPPIQPAKLPATPFFRTQHLACILPSLEFTRLEHAPPAHS